MEKQLPKNWVECTLGEIAEWGSGGTPSRGISEYYNGTIPWLKTGDLNDELITKVNEYITELGLKNSSAKLFPKDSVVIAMYGATIGKTGILGFDSTTNQACAVAIPYLNMNKFLFLLLKSEKDNFIEKGKGGAQPNISQAVIKSHKFLLPPLAEQNRIVAKLDTLFAQLETIKTSMAKIPVLLKEFRQQVLTQAVTGKLTEEWRKGKELGEWRKILFGELMIGTPKNGAYYSRDLYGRGIRIIRIDAFYDGKLKGWDFLQRVEVPEKDKEFYKIEIGNILINRVNSIEYLGKCMLVEELPEECIYESNMMRVILNQSIASPAYIKTFLTSSIGLKELRKKAKHAVNQASINQQDVKAVEVNLPSLKEQQEIVSRVESLFTKADAIEQQYLSVKEKIDNLPQALLHKAFKGALTEQLESDGNARELLLQIQELKNSTVKPKKATSKKVKKYPENETVLGMVAEGKEELSSKVIKLKPTNAEIYKRTLLAAEIVYQLKDTNTLGHLKLQKMLYLCQEIGSMNLPMNFLKQAMGPYDNQLARSLDKQFVVKKWFEYQNGALLKYKPLENCGNHKEDFQKYFETEVEQINYLINKFKKFTSNQIEAVATLYACWKEAIEQKELITDKLIINKFYQWSKEKEKFREENMIKALIWMRKNGIEPKSN